jgi:hypothetical protein
MFERETSEVNYQCKFFFFFFFRYRIGPFEVESVLQELDMVAESAVVASPDEVKISISFFSSI